MHRAARSSACSRVQFVVTAFLCCVVAPSCADAGAALLDPPSQARVSSWELSIVAPADPLTPGESAILTALAHNPGGNTKERSADWASSDSATVRVSSTGEITAVAPGDATITATAAGNSAQVVVSVVHSNIAVDFGAAQPHTKSASGFINGIGETSPPDARIMPLRARLWRGSSIDHAQRMTGRAARVEFIIGAGWGDPRRGWPNGRPYENWAGYEAYIRDRAAATAGMPFVYDVWNEPDTFYGQNFWDGTDEQFFETYRRTVRVIREELGGEVAVAGPSISRFDLDYLTRFLDYCLAKGCEVNFLTWHEFGMARPLSRLAEHVQTARRVFLDNPRYAPLKLREIHINEVIGARDILKPAANLAYMHHMESGGADAAARACWPEPTGESSCWNATLGGLLTPGTYEPRAVWWVARHYADGADARVASTTTDARVVSLASRAAPNASVAQVLVGYSDVDGPTAPALSRIGVRLEDVNLLALAGSAAKVRITVRQIPATTEAAVSALPTVFARDVEVTGGTARFIIENATVNAVYVIAITAAPDGA